MTARLEMRAVQKHVRLPDGSDLAILSGVDLEVHQGEVIAIVGKSGSGKSTLLNLLGLVDTPSQGELIIDGVTTSRLPDSTRARLRGARIGFVFQQFFLMDHRTALENVAEPLLYASRAEMRDRYVRAAGLLESVGLAHRLHALPTVLSGGEQQRVAIARSLVRNPGIILADEPTGALDVETGVVVLDILIDAARSHGATLILVTHDTDVAARADRVLTLEQGVLRA